jgi:D-inositol-3-phosphate glycosyltransferase
VSEPAAATRGRLLLVSANFRPSVGGVERFAETLGEGLAARGWDVVVLCCRDGDAPLREEAGGVHIVRIPSSDLLRRRWNVPYPLPSPVRLAGELRRLIAWADVVHVQDALYVTSAAALIAARRARVPSVLTQHVGFVPQASPVLDTAQRVAIASLGRVARLASRVAAYNVDVAAWARRTWRLRDVRVLPIGIAAFDADGDDRAAFRREVGLDEDRFLVLFAGRDVPKKRLDLALAAADPAFELVAVTDRHGSAAPAGTRILPFLAPERFRRLLLSADAFVLPSEAEGIPLALQEALASGVPCVVTRVAGYEHYLRDDDVLWVDPEPDCIRAALRRLASDETLRSELSERARAAGAREFGLERVLDAYEDLYGELLRPVSAAR